MALTVTKKKEVKKPVVENTTSKVLNLEEMTTEQLADHFGKLQDEAAAIETNPVFVQLDLAKKELLKRVNEAIAPEDGAELEGDEWILEIGACKSKPRKLKDIKEAAKLLGAKTFYSIATIKVADIEKYLTPEQAVTVLDNNPGYSDTRAITAKYKGTPVE